MSFDDFSARLLRWFDQHGRKDLPWQHPRTPYRVWLSEIMLQQTQVVTAAPYFLHFVEKLPSLPTLAVASEDDVLALWSGLGYYSRARNLRRAAQICVEQHGGELPADFDELVALPGIGRSTAGAILAQAFEKRFAILDGNVKRVLARHRGVRGWPGAQNAEKQLWKFADELTPNTRLADYTQAIMDLGATVCARSRPNCETCPVSEDCVSLRDGLIAQLPERKTARAAPTRQTLMLILRNGDGQILLQRRPPTGVWAGLWSFPEAADIEAAQQFATAYARTGTTFVFDELTPFTHTFSHYHLQIQPLSVQMQARQNVGDTEGSRWLYPAEAAALGLPAPVRKLLAGLQDQKDN